MTGREVSHRADSQNVRDATENNSSRIADLVAKAEIAVEKILRDLQEQTGKDISDVSVDTRNFSNLNVEIFMEEHP